MRKSNLLFIYILALSGMLSAPCLLSEATAQDRMPVCPPLGKTAKLIKPLREMNRANDTISVHIAFPSAFRETGRNEIIDSIALLSPVDVYKRQIITLIVLKFHTIILLVRSIMEIHVPTIPPIINVEIYLGRI